MIWEEKNKILSQPFCSYMCAERADSVCSYTQLFTISYTCYAYNNKTQHKSFSIKIAGI